MGIYFPINKSIQLIKGISIIVCTYNGRSGMLDLFTHFASLKIPAEFDWEIVLVDNASTDGTGEWVNELYQTNDWHFKLVKISEKKPGLNHARETGARTASFEWILFCDDDNWLEPDYLLHWYNIVNQFTDVGAVGGQGVLRNLNNLPAWVNKFGHSYALGPQASHIGYLPLGAALYGAGLFIKKSPVLNMLDNGFDWVMTDRKGNTLASGGDLEWCFLVQLNGYKLYYHDQMRFVHAIRSDRFNWSYYLKLKKGIASGAALLEPYKFLLLEGSSCPGFIVYLFGKLIMAQLVNIKQYLFHLITPAFRQTDDQQLGVLIVQVKASSYRKGFVKAVKHFRSLKKFTIANL